MCAIAVGGEALAANKGVYVLKSDTLEVVVAREFPRVIAYKDVATGAVFSGQDEVLSEVLLNGKAYTPTIKSKGPGKIRNRKAAAYKMVFPKASRVEMVAEFSLEGSILTFGISQIKDNKNFRIGSIEIPNHSLLSVTSKQPGAALAAATIHSDKAKRMDVFTQITTDLPKEDKHRSAAYVIISTDQLAATMENNSAYDDPKKNKKLGTNTKLGNGRIRIRVTATKDAASAHLASGEWTFRAKDSDLTEKTLWTKIIITSDRNADDQVDWQDGAIAFRDIMNNPFKAELTPTRIAQHISFNFGSQAGEPFLRALDNVKRVNYATDGLGQFVLLKGYQSEGHDSAHPDYGGNIGRRQGGKKDMNILIETAHDWNAEIGVHINCQETYPEAKTFEDDMLRPNQPGGWNWIDQSYLIDHRWDITSGAFEKRVAQMMEDVPGLDFIYMDVYWGDGWLSQEMARILNRAGVGITTEFPAQLEHAATWSHWSTDMNYGPDTSRGINSHIIRFIRNHQKDMYLKHPLLGHAELGDFEGWQGRTDFNNFIEKVYGAALPAKYLQHFKIMKWEDHEIRFTDKVRVTDASGKRQFFRGDRLVLEGDAYLLPWAPKKESKLYHWNVAGGETTWTLPPSWKTETVKLYQLKDTGRVLVADIPVKDGKVTLSAKAATPYVVYPSAAPKQKVAQWGQGSPIIDPGFYDKSLAAWTVVAEEGVVSITEDDHVRTALTVGKSDKPATVSQVVSGLKPGTYSASVWVEVEEGTRKALLEVAPKNGKAVNVWTDSSTLEATACNMHWNRTRMQRMRVLFDVPEGSDSATLSLVVDPGTSPVRLDDLRVVESVHTTQPGYAFFEDFEDIDEGWFPFVKGPAGGINDPRTHLSERHSPYTDAGWNDKLIDDTLGGEWSLKSHSERLGPNGTPGLIYRTLSQTLRFVPGNRYEVSFDYQCAYDDEYEFVIGVDEAGESKILSTIPFSKTRKTKRFKTVIKPGKANVWIGVQRMKKNEKGKKEVDLVIDNLGVRKLNK
jgi:endo-alpha-N-acetylgalactosaminidase